MDFSDYQELVCFLESNTYPERMQENSSKADKNRRDNFRSKAKKFFLKGTLLWLKLSCFFYAYCVQFDEIQAVWV